MAAEDAFKKITIRVFSGDAGSKEVLKAIASGKSLFASAAEWLQKNQTKIDDLLKITTRLEAAKFVSNWAKEEYNQVIKPILSGEGPDQDGLKNIAQRLAYALDVLNIFVSNEPRFTRSEERKIREEEEKALHNGIGRIVLSFKDVLRSFTEAAHFKLDDALSGGSGSKLNVFINQSILSVMLGAGAKGIAVEVDIPEGTNIKVSYEAHEKIQEILTELLNNAVKYSDSARENTIIRVRVVDGTIRVEDNGIGIKNTKTIFDKDHREEHAAKINEGTGLGLHASKKDAKELGWSLTAESEGMGQGSTFILTPPDGVIVLE